jgi:hypothetical protein
MLPRSINVHDRGNGAKSSFTTSDNMKKKMWEMITHSFNTKGHSRNN